MIYMDITTSCRDIKQLRVQAQKACTLFLSECKKQGLDVCITETYRSQERQNYLYEQGRSRSGNIVTWTKNSRHTSRMAWDICKNVKGAEYSDSSFFKKCGDIAKGLGITWGGNWKQVDTPHFEINLDWKEPVGDDEMITKIKVLINGVEKEVEAINKEGNNFIKLQSLNTDRITISYDSEKKLPIILIK